MGRRREQGRLLVEVRVEADVSWPTHTMAAADYEELERLFHSDLQTLDLQVRPLCCIYGGVLPRVGFFVKKIFLNKNADWLL